MRPEITIDQCQLYKCRSKKRLAEILYIERADFNDIPTWATYRISHLEKGDGGTRAIYSPCERLKTVQKRIKRLLERIRKPSWVFSGTKGKCHVDNAMHHAGNTYFVLSDIAEFYESCTRDAVYKFFLNEMKTSPDVAGLLADITTLETNGKTIIPTGSPSGQLLAFFSYREMFDELEELAARHGCRLSLYVDDLTISSNTPIANPKSLQKQLARIMASYGHSIKWSKTRYVKPSEFKVVTGVAIGPDGAPHIPNNLGRAIIGGLQDALGGDCLSQASTLGRINAARQIVEGSFPEVERVLCGDHRHSP